MKGNIDDTECRAEESHYFYTIKIVVRLRSQKSKLTNGFKIIWQKC